MTPLRTLVHNPDAPDQLVLLPGAYIRPEDFGAHGFFASAATRTPTLGLTAVDLDLATLSAGNALARLDTDIIAPLRKRRPRRLWLGGISLGGLLTLSYAADRIGPLDGLCLLAPYPGSRLTTLAIERAGGLAAWTLGSEALNDPEFRVWHWLQAPPPGLPVFIGYGRDDRFAAGMAALAACFPAARRVVVDGGHDWAAWEALWAEFLAFSGFVEPGA